MTTYDDNLHVAVDDILSTTAAQKQKTNSAQISAQYSLYFSQGTLLTAEDKLAKVKKKYDTAHLIDIQGIKNSNVATNLSSTTKDADAEVSATKSATATAATDVQIAAKAVSKLAADIGAAFNLASASNFDSDIYHMAETVNGLIQTTSYNAELASKSALEASAASAEIISSVLVKEVELVNSEIEDVLKTTTAEFDRLQTQRNIDNKRVAMASKQERAAEGTLADTELEYKSLCSTLKTSNKLLNHNLELVCPPSTSKKISIDFSFQRYKYPFPKADDRKSKNAATTDDSNTINYYAVFVKAANKTLFTVEKAEATFSQYQEGRFHPVTPSSKTHSSNTIEIDKKLLDSDGEALSKGKAYVAFLYIELPQKYKRDLNDFSDLLSAPTDEFTPQYRLPLPAHIELDGSVKDDDRSIKFTIAKPIKGTEYRCIFIPTNKPARGVFMTNRDDLDNLTESGESDHVGIYFNQSIAEQVSAGNYVEMKSDRASPTHYQGIVPIDSTDNFGNEIVKGENYFVVVLALMGDSTIYPSEMSYLTAHRKCIFDD